MILKSVSVLLGMIIFADNLVEAQRFTVAQNEATERPAGLLALPDIFGEYPCMVVEPGKLDLYATPSRERPPIAAIERFNPPRQPERPDCEESNVVVRHLADNSTGPLPTDEKGYEELAAVVYERSANWFRIATPKGSGWIERAGPEGFLSYPEGLASDSFLTHLRPGWDGNIWTSPAAAKPERAPAAWLKLSKEHLPVRVIATETRQGEKWIRVRFENESCGREFGNLPQLEGWLPAYRPSKETTVWFSSRGC